MRNRLIIIVVIVLAVSIGLAIAWEAFSYKNVNFTLKDKGYTVDVYDKNDKEVTTLSSSSQIKLKEGEYGYRVDGDTYNGEKVIFTVKGAETAVEVTPSFSDKYLEELLTEERSSIEAILSSTYQEQTYTIQTLQLYEKGNWAAGTLAVTPDPRQLPDTYRFVLQKVNDIWTIIAPPQIAISKTKYKNIPEAIVYSLYSNED